MPDYSLVNLGDLTKPATVLIENISNAVGTLWEPRYIRQVAEAKAHAAIAVAKSDIEIDQMTKRAARRFVEEETTRQSNMENISMKAIKGVNPEAPTENVMEDWITNFFDKCRIVSNDDMQELWARILTGEANAPGSFSRKTVNLMADIDKASAELFTTLCRLSWQYEDTLIPLILDTSDDMYIKYGITLYSLGLMESIGLVQINPLGLSITDQPAEITFAYYGRPVRLRFPKDEGNRLNVGQVMFTPPGEQLSGIVETSPLEGFFEFIYEKWAEESLVPLEWRDQEMDSACPSHPKRDRVEVCT